MLQSEPDLDALRDTYKTAVEVWIAAIKAEEALAFHTRNVAEIDEWEAAGFREEAQREKAKDAKAAFEEALRQVHFNF